MIRPDTSQTVRHHVHVCYVPGDVQRECAAIKQQLNDKAFFTWSEQTSDPVLLGVARKQIDEADYVIVLVGEQYGQLSSSGVSQLHLDFIYAMNQSKPMLVCNLIVADTGGSNFDERKMQEFKQQAIRCGKPLLNYTNSAELHAKLLTGYLALVAKFPSAGWSKKTLKTLPTLTAQLGDRTQEIRAISLPLGGDRPQKDMGHYQVSLQDSLEVIYSVHAYQGGNLRELRVKKKLVWGDVLVWVGEESRMPVFEGAFERILNEQLQLNSLTDVKLKLPEAHATAKIRIESTDLERVRNQFLHNDWLGHTHQMSDSHKKFMLTPYGARQMAQWKNIKARLTS